MKSLQSATESRPARKSVRFTFVILGVALTAACSNMPSGQRFDVGSMAHPEPPAHGAANTTSVVDHAPFDTGSMAYPSALPQGKFNATVIPQGQQASDTGSMAYPVPPATGTGRLGSALANDAQR